MAKRAVSTETKGYDRLVYFTDAVTAIAATLLILPVVDAASTLKNEDIPDFIAQFLPGFLMFLLSFVVIVNFWLEHHRLFRRIDKFDNVMLYLSFAWLIGIVTMPVPTALVVSSSNHDRFEVAFYIGTMLEISLMQYLMARHVERVPSLEHGEGTTASRLLGSRLSVIYMSIAFVLSLAFPELGLYPLFLLFLIPLTIRIIRGKAPEPVA